MKDTQEEKRQRSLEAIKAEARAYALAESAHPKRVRNRRRGVTPIFNNKTDGTSRSPTAIANTAAPSRSTADANAAVVVTENAKDSEATTELPHTLASTIKTDEETSHAGSGDVMDEDYAAFVKGLNLDFDIEGDDSWHALLDDDEEDEFQIDPLDEEDDDEEEDEEEEEEDDREHGNSENGEGSPPIKNDHGHHGHVDIVKYGTPDTTVRDNHVAPSSAMDDRLFRELDEELCWLEQEDMEAAVATLLVDPASTSHPSNQPLHDDEDEEDYLPSSPQPLPLALLSPSASNSNQVTITTNYSYSGAIDLAAMTSSDSPASSSEVAAATAAAHRVVPVTPHQHQQLQSLLARHQQLLLQQAVLSVRAAHHHRVRLTNDATTIVAKSMPQQQQQQQHAMTTTNQGGTSPPPKDLVVGGSESGEDLVLVLDGAVGMLQDLHQHRKDAIRHHIQYQPHHDHQYHHVPSRSGSRATTVTKLDHSPKRALFPDVAGDDSPTTSTIEESRRLTRAQFTKKLLLAAPDEGVLQTSTVFAVPGLAQLDATFRVIDESVHNNQLGTRITTSHGEANANVDEDNIINLVSTNQACEKLIRHSGSTLHPHLIPGHCDWSHHFVDATELLGAKFVPPCTVAQKLVLQKNRYVFTAGEDNLVLRGVNLYGEKQWSLIGDRYLPERSINFISQRYSKLCLMLYRAHGIPMDRYGNLVEPPKVESIDDLDQEELGSLQRVEPPAILNVHRWSIAEDLTLLKAVSVMGSMWAELRARLIPHRDRGHLRKRYQVLERRVKATAARVLKTDINLSLAPLTTSKNNIRSLPITSTTKNAVPSVLKTTMATVARRKSSTLPVAATTNATIANSKPTTAVMAPSKNQTGKQSSKSRTEPTNSKLGERAMPNDVPPYHHLPYHHHPAYMYHHPPAHPYHHHPPVPYQYHQPYYPPPTYSEENSWVAYERLAHESGPEWSQMTNMKKMMENESDIVTGGSTPQLNKSDNTQLSSIKAKSKSTSNATVVDVGITVPDADPGARDTTIALKSKDPTSQEGTPAKPMPRSNVFPPRETPMDHLLQCSQRNFSEKKTLYMNNSPSETMRTFPHGSSPFVYRHSEFSRTGQSMDGYELNGEFSNSVLYDKRETLLTGLGSTNHITSRGASTFDDSALLLENDMEAVSALNLLKSPPNSILSNDEKKQGSSNAKKTERKSLFAEVVGSVNDKGTNDRNAKRARR